MNKLLKILGGILGVVLLVVIGGLSFLQFGFPDASPAENLQIEVTPEVLERGRYLTENVSLCMDCHSKRDLTYFPPKILAGTEGSGGDRMAGVPGTVYVPNITPAALKDWSDGEVARSINVGLDKDDNPLVPMMPYGEYRHMAKEDLQAVVAYLRTLPSIDGETSDPSIDFPLNFIFRTIPTDANPPVRPDSSDVIGTGKYLARIAGCFFCHSPVEQGVPIPGQEFAGGHEYNMEEYGIVRTSNLTPDKETGIGNWTKEAFVARFKAYADSSFEHRKITPGKDMQTVMPWTLLAGMTEKDLGAIYEYLRTVKPIRNAVVRFSPAE